MFAYMGASTTIWPRPASSSTARAWPSPHRPGTSPSAGTARPVITDGPYSETKELLAGYWVLDCESLERVTEIAARVARCPQPAGAPDYPVVIRPDHGRCRGL